MDMTSMGGRGQLDSKGLDFWDCKGELNFLVLEEGGEGKPDGELIILVFVGF